MVRGIEMELFNYGVNDGDELGLDDG